MTVTAGTVAPCSSSPVHIGGVASRSHRRESRPRGASSHWCRSLVVGAVFRVALFRLSATSPLISALRRCAGRRLRGAEAAGRVPEAGGVWASCLLAPAGAGRAWVSEFLGRCCFAPLVEPPPEPAPRSGAKSRFGEVLVRAGFAPRVQGSVLAGLGDAGAAACHAGLIWCRSPLRYRDFCRNPVKRTGHGWPEASPWLPSGRFAMVSEWHRRQTIRREPPCPDPVSPSRR